MKVFVKEGRKEGEEVMKRTCNKSESCDRGRNYRIWGVRKEEWLGRLQGSTGRDVGRMKTQHQKDSYLLSII